MRRQETVALGLQSDPEEEVCHLSSKSLCGRIQFQVCFWVLETISLHVLLAVNPLSGATGTSRTTRARERHLCLPW